MESLLGFDLDLWDYLTFLTMMLVVVAVITIWIVLAGLPGRIALARKHPEAEAVKLLGFAGLLPTIYPWVQAFIWAFKPTNIIDIRRFPREEAKAIDEEIARLGGQTAKPDAAPIPAPPQTHLPPPTRKTSNDCRSRYLFPVCGTRLGGLLPFQMAEIQHHLGCCIRFRRASPADHLHDWPALHDAVCHRGQGNPAHHPADPAPA
jgi:hypothetical protein